jgi:hypothetical protein
MGNRSSFWRRLGRLVHYRLVIPLKRSRHPPEHTARGVGIGLFWGFTPLVGVQMYLALMTWLALRRSARFEFSLLVACAWTWVTNVFTMWPVYYVFYVTGKLVLGDWRGELGYKYVVGQLKAAFATGDDVISGLIATFGALVKEDGLPMAIGSIPYALLFGWLGYRWSLAYLTERQRHRERRLDSALPAGGIAPATIASGPPTAPVPGEAVAVESTAGTAEPSDALPASRSPRR